MVARSRATTAERARPVRRWTVGRGQLWLLRGLSLVIVLGVWEWYGRRTNPILFTYPTAIAQAAVEVAGSGQLGRALLQSLTAFSMGLGSAMAVGIGLGFVVGRSRVAEALLEIPINALYATPTVALVPVMVLWFGFGLPAKVWVVFLFAVFAILINTARGVKEVDPQLIEVARSFSAGEAGLWKDVVLPSALPFIVTGLRLAVGRALVGIVVAELLTAISGLGFLIVTYANSFETAKVFVPITILMMLGVVLTALLQLIEDRLAPWQRRNA
jgi:ABC-type nitrate/sulfonate/bicarbonate transport system permease component